VISLHQPAERDQQLLLMRYAIRISRQSIIHALKTEKMETAYTLFAKGLLKNCYPLFMEQLSDLTDVYMAHTLSEPVYLHPKLGLVLGEL
jgi:hypothetical protein